jgi:putative ABC transport system permease protein
METFIRDFRYGFRMLLKRRSFTFMAILALLLGIGANTAIFSVINAVMLRPLPYTESDRLIRIWENNPGRGWTEFSASEPNYYDWFQQNEVFEHLAAEQSATFNLTGDGEPERIIGAYATANFLPALGVSPALGRNFLPEEDRPGSQPVVVMTHKLWQRRFGSDPNLVGRTIKLSDESYTVTGILPKGFSFVSGAELWVPLARNLAQSNRSNHILRVIGRLKPGITLDQARANMEAIANRLQQQYPASNAGWGVKLKTFYDWIIPEGLRRALLVLQAAVAFVLLIACANVMNLLLAQATTRQREIAIRRALGASRVRIIQQLLTESTIIALLGGAAGVLLAMWTTDLLAAGNIVLAIPRLDEVRLDSRVLGFTLGISLLTGLIFGLVPALQVSKPDLNTTLKESVRSSSGVRGRLRSALVVAEIALVLVLLVGSGLMIQSFLHLQKVPLGFEHENVLTMRITLPNSKYGENVQRVDFFNQLLERFQTVPGVVNSAAISQVPFSGGNWAMEVTLEGATTDLPLSADVRAVTPNYFRTMGIPFLQGRDFTDQDRGDAPLTLIVSETFARSFWPNENPIGKKFRPGMGNPFGTVIGVVGNVRNLSLENEARPAFYFSYGHVGMGGLTVVVRTAAQPESLLSALRAQVLELDPNLPIYSVSAMEKLVSNASGQPKFYTLLLGIFGVVALMLASIGIYGVISCSVTQRTQEIGVRVALGAQPRHVLKLVIGQGLALIVTGIAFGLIASLGLIRLMSGMLYGVKATDPTTLLLISVLLSGVALLACYLPARRAMKVDPIVALRYE